MLFLTSLLSLAHADVDPCAWRLNVPAGVRAIPVMKADRTDEHGRAVCSWLVTHTAPLELGATQRGPAFSQDRIVIRRADGQPLQVLTEATTTPVHLPLTFLVELASPAPQTPEGLFATVSLADPS